MKITFCLAWASKGISKKSFGSEAAFALFSDYTQRISRFAPPSAGRLSAARPAGMKLWLCHTSAESKSVSSEKLAQFLARLQNSGVKELQVGIGGPDGFPAEEIQALKPDFLWSFGPLTLPHELAAAVAAEQLYRAYTILHKLPYHCGH